MTRRSNEGVKHPWGNRVAVRENEKARRGDKNRQSEYYQTDGCIQVERNRAPSSGRENVLLDESRNAVGQTVLNDARDQSN